VYELSAFSLKSIGTASLFTSVLLTVLTCESINGSNAELAADLES